MCIQAQSELTPFPQSKELPIASRGSLFNRSQQLHSLTNWTIIKTKSLLAYVGPTVH